MLSPNLPLISIIIPYYNCKEYIAETLQSIEMQTYMNIETIVVNDGSDRQNTAYIESLIQRKKAEQKNIHYAYQTNKGVSSARNTGGRLACGDYILFLDADDKLHPEFIQKTLSAFIHTPNCVLAYTKAEFFDAKAGEWKLPPYAGIKSLLMGNKIPVTALHRMSDFIRLHGFDETLQNHEDWDYWIRLLKDGGAVAYLTDILFFYRKRQNNSSLSDSLLNIGYQRVWQAVYDKNKELYLQHNLSFFDLASSVTNAESWQKKYEEMSAVQVTTLATQTHVLNQQTALIEQINALQEKLAEHEPIIKEQQKEIQLWQKKYEDSIQENNTALNQYNATLSHQLSLADKNNKLQKDLIAAAQEALAMKSENARLSKENMTILADKALAENHLALINHAHQNAFTQLEQQSHKHKKYKNLVILQLLKPLIQLEIGLHSLNRYRKAFRILAHDKGSIGKAYQTVRRHVKQHGLKSGKHLLKKTLTDNRSAFDAPVLFTQALEYKSDYQPKVSVIVPNYNHADYMVDRLSSIINQSYKNIELIILDDNSSDNSIAVIEGFLADKSIDYQLIKNEKNSGNVFQQWKKGFELATGELVWICESDDSCEPNFLQEIVPHFREQTVNIAFGRIQFIDKDGNFLEGLDAYRERSEQGIWQNVCIRPAFEWFNQAFGVSNVFANASGGLIRRQSLAPKIWENATNFKICGDWYLYLHFANAGKIAYIPTAVSYFRQHQKNTSASNFNQLYYYEEHFRILSEIKKVWRISLSTEQKFIDSIKEQYERMNMQKTQGEFHLVFKEQFSHMNQLNDISLHIQIYFLGFHPGGGELFPIVLANQLKTLGHTISMVALDFNYVNLDMKNKLNDSIPVYHISELQNNPHFLKNLGVDVIHTHISGADHHLINYLERHNLSIPYLVTMHGSHDRTFGDYNIASTEKMIKYVSKWIYIADKNLAFFHDLSIPKNIEKLPNAMPKDTNKSVHSRRSLGIKDTDIVFAFAARGIFEKGWLQLVTAFETVLKKEMKQNIHLVLMGSGDATNEAKKLSTHTNIHFLGYESAVNDVLAFSDCAILPSRFAGESYPLFLIQAIQEHLPCIATDIGEINNMLAFNEQESAGILLPNTQNDAEFIEALSNAISTMCDDKIRLAYQACSKKIADRYDMNSLALEYLAQYADAMQINSEKQENL